MTTDRPSLKRKHTRTTEESRKSQLDLGARITIDGETYEVRAGDLSGLHTARLRREAGYSFRRLLELLTEDPDLDVIGIIVWLARITHGDVVTLDEVLTSLGYDSLEDEGFDVKVIDTPEEVDDSPEA